MTDAQIDEAVKAVFGKYDTDKSGTLDEKELKKVIQDIFTHMGDKRTISDEDAKKVLVAMDSSKDGKVSPDELKNIIKRVMQAK